MAATLKLNYSQIYKLATQLSTKDMERLSMELAAICDEARENSRPYTVEEVKARARKSMEDIKAGRTHDVDILFNRVDNNHPWLCES